MDTSDYNAIQKKVFIGLSGGVDSSVSATLLKEQGYDVTGVFIKVWQPDFIECTWKEDRLDAMRVASLLDIPFVTLDLEKEYKEGVIDYMLEEYKKGRTPNPDVMCNREVKFGAFYTWAKKQGADYIATGHYAMIAKNHPADVVAGPDEKTRRTTTYDSSSHFPAPSHQNNFLQSFSLKKSKDENKDQTYFLWTLSKNILPSVLFPIGGMEKSEVRVLAEKYKLPVAAKKDSQGLCFVGTIDVKTLLKQYIDEKEGDVINEKGEVIGKHTGVMFYTIGERHGFTITKKSTDDAPYFVNQKDFEKNTITVSHIPPQEVVGEIISLTSCNWTQELEKGKVYDARARYRAPLARIAYIDGNDFKVIDGELVATPGQSLVIYDGELCVGGGIIV